MKQRPSRPKAGRKSDKENPHVEPAAPLSPGRKLLFRFLALAAMPLVLLAVVAALLEIGLRLGGYGYDPRFFRPIRVDGPEYFINNEKFSQRILPGSISAWQIANSHHQTRPRPRSFKRRAT